MALIMCPECNKEISDKSEACIHCGYPLINYICDINGIEYNLKEELALALVNNDDWTKAVGSLRRKTSLTLSDGVHLIETIRESRAIPNKFVPKWPLEDREKLYGNQQNKIQCPYCKSTDTKKISGLSKAGSVALFGIFAMGKASKQWHCNNCNSDF